jgi:hypothetical protein
MCSLPPLLCHMTHILYIDVMHKQALSMHVTHVPCSSCIDTNTCTCQCTHHTQSLLVKLVLPSPFPSIVPHVHHLSRSLAVVSPHSSHILTRPHHERTFPTPSTLSCGRRPACVFSSLLFSFLACSSRASLSFFSRLLLSLGG